MFCKLTLVSVQIGSEKHSAFMELPQDKAVATDEILSKVFPDYVSDW